MVQALIRFTLVVAMLCGYSLSFAAVRHAYPPSYTQPYTQATTHPMVIANTIQNLTPFTQLDVSGKVNVIIKNSSRNSIEFLNGSNELVRLTTKANKLILSRILLPNIKNSATDPSVVLNVTGLNKITTDGYASVRGQLNSPALNMTALGHSQISLTGMVNVQTIRAAGYGNVKLYWVNSPNLVVTATNNSLVQLAGTTQLLHASLRGAAQLRAQYLRAQQAIIQTDNTAYAGITATQALRAFASDDSNIFYYKYPRNYNDFSIDSGNILQVDWRP